MNLRAGFRKRQAIGNYVRELPRLLILNYRPSASYTPKQPFRTGEGAAARAALPPRLVPVWVALVTKLELFLQRCYAADFREGLGPFHIRENGFGFVQRVPGRVRARPGPVSRGRVGRGRVRRGWSARVRHAPGRQGAIVTTHLSPCAPGQVDRALNGATSLACGRSAARRSSRSAPAGSAAPHTARRGQPRPARPPTFAPPPRAEPQPCG